MRRVNAEGAENAEVAEKRNPKRTG